MNRAEILARLKEIENLKKKLEQLTTPGINENFLKTKEVGEMKNYLKKVLV